MMKTMTKMTKNIVPMKMKMKLNKKRINQNLAKEME